MVRMDAEAPWVARVAFGGVLLVAVGLVAVVGLAPLLDPGTPRPHGLTRVVATFARDVVLRRTSLASSAGLLVVAFVFLRPKPMGRVRATTATPSRSTPPPPVVGA